MFRHSWSQALFVGEPLETSLARLARYGYDGVELPMSERPSGEIRAALATHRVPCCSINGSYAGADRDLSSPDVALRAAAVAYVGRCMRHAAELGAAVVVVVPTRIGKLRPDTTLADEWRWAVQSLRAVGALGRRLGVTAVVECVNRSETYLANRLETALRLVEAVDSAHVQVMADSFHMNIEEDDPLAALAAAGAHLRHVHLAANNRAAPGMGHLDLAPFLATLRRIGYTGPLTIECDVQASDAYGRAAASTEPADFDRYAATAIRTLRDIESRLASRGPIASPQAA